jgi:hypothetical protein
MVLDLTGGAGGCLLAGLALGKSVFYNDLDGKQVTQAWTRFNESKLKFFTLRFLVPTVQ